MSTQPIVYQVRAVDVHGNVRVIHAYETQQAAAEAIATMKGQTGKKYIAVPLSNDPDQHWGINFPEKK